MPGDSQSYLLPAYDLVRGLGFDPIIKRPLGYPLFVAGVMALAGEDLRALVFAQVLIGLGTVATTYWIGRLAYGPIAGFLAGVSVAIGGQLLIYEHFVLAESLFALLIALAILGLIAAVKRGARAALLGGLALGIAALVRPVAEIVVPLVPAFFLVVVQARRRAVVLSLAAFGGLALALVPASVVDSALRGGPAAGAVGEHLLWRITRSESGYFTRDSAGIEGAWGNRGSDAARQFVVRRALDRALPQEIYHALRRDHGLSPAEADRLMLEVAVDAIRSQFGRYLLSTARMSVELFLGEDQRLGEIAKRDAELRYSNPQSKQRSWFDERILHLGEPPVPAVQNEFERAELIAGLYQPGRLGRLLLVLFLIGLAFSAAAVPNRLALLPAVSVLAMLVLTSALAGPEARFRYPLDPLIAVVAAGGLVGAASAVRSLVRRPGLTPAAAPRPG